MKTTKHHFEMFKAECEKWIERFGMFGWRYYYQHEDLKEGSQIAYCFYPEEPTDRVFTLGLSINLQNLQETELDIRRSAFHEVMESFLFRMNYLAKARYIQPEEINEENHHIIRTLENVVFTQRP